MTTDDKTRVEMCRIETTTPNKTVDVEVYYDLGGHNAFQQVNEQRGYYVSATPCTRERGMKSYMAFSGTKMLLEAATRFNRKKLLEVVAKARERPEYQRVIDVTVEKGKITLKKV